MLAELLALRTILLNLHFHLCSGTTVTAETMQRLIERADQDKRQQAEARLDCTRAEGPVSYEWGRAPEAGRWQRAVPVWLMSVMLIAVASGVGMWWVRQTFVLDTAAAVLSVRLHAERDGELARASDRPISPAPHGEPPRHPTGHR